MQTIVQKELQEDENNLTLKESLRYPINRFINDGLNKYKELIITNYY